jgi:membrane protein required for colicin V production
MTIYDGVMIGLVGAGMIWGAWRGIVWQLASMASLVLGYVVSHQVSAQLAPHFPGPPIVARSLAMMAVYAASSGGVFLVAWFIRATLRQLRFEAFDRHLGMLLGGLEGALVGLVATLFIVSFAPQSRAAIFGSPTGHVVGRVMDNVGPVLPSEVRKELEPFFAAESGTVAVDSRREAEPEPEPKSKSKQKASASSHRQSKSTTTAQTSDGSTSLEQLFEDGEKRVTRAVVDVAKKELEQAGTANGRDVERR